MLWEDKQPMLRKESFLEEVWKWSLWPHREMGSLKGKERTRCSAGVPGELLGTTGLCQCGCYIWLLCVNRKEGQRVPVNMHRRTGSGGQP